MSEFSFLTLSRNFILFKDCVGTPRLPLPIVCTCDRYTRYLQGAAFLQLPAPWHYTHTVHIIFPCFPSISFRTPGLLCRSSSSLSFCAAFLLASQRLSTICTVSRSAVIARQDQSCNIVNTRSRNPVQDPCVVLHKFRRLCRCTTSLGRLPFSAL